MFKNMLTDMNTNYNTLSIPSKITAEIKKLLDDNTCFPNQRRLERD
jgi:hypothetical protein